MNNFDDISMDHDLSCLFGDDIYQNICENGYNQSLPNQIFNDTPSNNNDFNSNIVTPDIFNDACDMPYIFPNGTHNNIDYFGDIIEYPCSSTPIINQNFDLAMDSEKLEVNVTDIVDFIPVYMLSSTDMDINNKELNCNYVSSSTENTDDRSNYTITNLANKKATINLINIKKSSMANQSLKNKIGPICQLSDNELISISTPELNKLKKIMSKEDQKSIMRRRRQLKNRGYAKKCRQRRVEGCGGLKEENENLKMEIQSLKIKNISLEKKVEDLKQKLLKISNGS